MRNDTQAKTGTLADLLLSCRTAARRETDDERILLLGMVEPRLDKTN
jgi:hypothetical protein